MSRLHETEPQRTQHPPRDLVELARHECTALQGILDATREFRSALSGRDPERLETALSARRTALHRLQDLQGHHAACAAAPQRDGRAVLRLELSCLQDLATQVRTLETQLHNETEHTVTSMRGQLKHLQRGAQLLRGYAGDRHQTPRFADRTG